jgi:hypothetical protein
VLAASDAAPETTEVLGWVTRTDDGDSGSKEETAAIFGESRSDGGSFFRDPQTPPRLVAWDHRSARRFEHVMDGGSGSGSSSDTLNAAARAFLVDVVLGRATWMRKSSTLSSPPIDAADGAVHRGSLAAFVDGSISVSSGLRDTVVLITAGERLCGSCGDAEASVAAVAHGAASKWHRFLSFNTTTDDLPEQLR